MDCKIFQINLTFLEKFVLMRTNGKRGNWDMNHRQQQALETKQKLIHSAKKLMASQNYDSITVDQIVADCGVAKGTFYHYFRSKDELLTQICHSVYDNLNQQAETLTQLSCLEKIGWFISNWHQLMSSYNLQFARQTVQLYANSAESGKYGENLSQMEKGIEILQKYLTEAVQQGELKPSTPVPILAKALMFTMQGSTLYHCMHEHDFDVLAWNQDFMQHIFHPLLQPYLTVPWPR